MSIKQKIKSTASNLLYIVVAAFISLPAVAGDDFDTKLEASGQSLVLNGEGPRKKAFITLYDTALYLAAKSKDASAIVQSDEPMAIVIKMVSGLANAKRMAKAMREGFEQSMGGDTSALQTEIDAMLTGVIDKGVEPGDVFSNIYVPGKGVVLLKNGEEAGVIEGLEFKQALFGIWLGKDPIQSKLKKNLLGK